MISNVQEAGVGMSSPTIKADGGWNGHWCDWESQKPAQIDFGKWIALPVWDEHVISRLNDDNVLQVFWL